MPGDAAPWYPDEVNGIPLAVLLALAAAPLAAQTVPAGTTAPAAGAELADLLRALKGRAPRDAEARIKALAESGDASAQALSEALSRREARPPLLLELAPFDADGSLSADFRILAASLEAAHRGDAAASLVGEDKHGPLPGGPGEEEKEGWEHRTEVFAGATGVPGRRLPATGFAQESEYNKGPWKAELGARGLFAPTGSGLPSDGTLEATGSRKLGSSPFRLFAGAELHRDDLMGLSRHFSAHAGVEAEILDTKRQQLTASFGAGGATEKHLDGESERHPLTLTSLEYALKVSARTAFHQELELESNPRSRKDYELKSVTAFVYDLSEHLSVRAARVFMKRGDPVPGYASRRNETTIGLVLH
jgi:Protein of unknown function, DUF481